MKEGRKERIELNRAKLKSDEAVDGMTLSNTLPILVGWVVGKLME